MQHKQEPKRIFVIGHTGYPVLTIECCSYSIDGDTLLWLDSTGNQKAYRLKGGETIDVLAL